MPEVQRLDPVPRGEARSYMFRVLGADDEPLDLDGKKLVSTFRRNGAVAFVKRNEDAGGNDDEIECVDDGCRVKLASEDTLELEPCILDGDLWVYTSGQDPVRIAKFRLPVDQTQTREFP